MLKCIIVDDEQFSVDALLKYIDLIPELEISAIFTNPLQALNAITAAEPADVLFMDIDMPDISGLELARAVRSKTKKLIFTTAHSKYAFDAYEVEGDAFLLKPYSFARFSTTINRLFAERWSKTPVVVPDDHFLIKSKNDDLAIVKVRFSEVVAFESAQNYIRIHLADKRVLVAYLTIKDVLQLLKDRPGFVQLHRAFIIATDQINQIKGGHIQLSNNLAFPVGENYRPAFSAYLEEKLLVTSRKQ